MDRTISSGLRLLRLGYNLKAFGALLTEQLCAQRTQPLVLPLRKLLLQKLQLLLGSGVMIWPWAILSYALTLRSKKALVILLPQRLFGTIFVIVMVLQPSHKCTRISKKRLIFASILTHTPLCS